MYSSYVVLCVLYRDSFSYVYVILYSLRQEVEGKIWLLCCWNFASVLWEKNFQTSWKKHVSVCLSFKCIWSTSKKWFEELPCWLSYYIWCYFLGIVLISSYRVMNSYQINSKQSKVFWGAGLKCMCAISLFFLPVLKPISSYTAIFLGGEVCGLSPLQRKMPWSTKTYGSTYEFVFKLLFLLSRAAIFQNLPYSICL